MATKEELTTMLDDTAAENERLKAELKAMKEEAEKKAEKAKASENDPKRMVTIELFKDSGKYKDAVYVNVNNYNALIPRGKRVSVPYYVYLHIQEMLKQDAATANMIRMYEAEWQKNAATMGM